MADVVDFELIFLSQTDQGILNEISTGAVMTLHPVNAAHLLSLGFIAPYDLANIEDQYVITPNGRLYKEYYDEQLLAQRQSKANVKFSKVVSLLALLVSMGSLVISILAFFSK